MPRSHAALLLCSVAGLLATRDVSARPTVVWSNAAGGLWSVGSNWAGGASPSAADDALINIFPGPLYTVTLAESAAVRSLTLSSAIATVMHTGGTLDLQQGNLSVQNGSYRLAGGTITNANILGAFSVESGTFGQLSNVHLDGNAVIGHNASLIVNGDFSMGANWIMRLNQSFGVGSNNLQFMSSGSQLVSGGTFVFDGQQAFSNITALGGTVTLSPTTTIRAGTQGGTVSGSFINNGLIACQTSGQVVSLSGGGGTFVNGSTGVLSAAASGTLRLSGAWANAGTFSVFGGGNLELGGEFSHDSIAPARWNRTGGEVTLTGVLNNGANTLLLNQQTGTLRVGTGGVINGGTITTADGARLSFNNLGGTLNGVTLDTDVHLDFAGTMNVTGGLTLAPNRRIFFGFNNPTLQFGTGATQTLGGSGELVFDDVGSVRGKFALGAGIVVRSGLSGGTVGDSMSWANHGLISSRTAGKTITLLGGNAANPLVNEQTGVIEAVNGGTIALRGHWTNHGLLVVNEGVMDLGGTFKPADISPFRWQRTGGAVEISGTLTNTGNIMVFDDQVGSVMLKGGTIDGGAIRTTGGSQFSTSTLNSRLINGVVLEAGVSVQDQLTITGGVTVAAGRQVSISDALLDFQGAGSQMLQGQGEVVLRGSSGNNAIRASASTLEIGSGMTVRTGEQGGLIGAFGSLVNHGTIVAGTQGKSIQLGATSSPVLANTGTIIAENGGVITVRRTGGFSSNSGALIARTGGRIQFNGGLPASTNGPISFELSSASPTTGYGRVTITGAASITGADINVSLTDGFMPDWGDRFDILSFSAHFGDMSTLVLPTLSDPVNLRWWRELTFSSFSIGVRLVADTNHDGVVNFTDVNNVLSFFGQTGTGLLGDANEDGVVNFTDLNHVLSDFGRVAPVNAVPAPAGVALAMMGLGMAGGRRQRAR